MSINDPREHVQHIIDRVNQIDPPYWYWRHIGVNKMVQRAMYDGATPSVHMARTQYLISSWYPYYHHNKHTVN